MSCNKVGDNKYNDCPALMSDGRIFTDYKASCIVNENLRNKNNLETSDQYRLFLINNAKKIMKTNKKFYEHMASCEKCD